MRKQVERPTVTSIPRGSNKKAGQTEQEPHPRGRWLYLSTLIACVI